MGSLSNFAELSMLDHVLGTSVYTSPAATYLALLTAAPDDTSTGATITEATYTGYGRKAITFGAPAARVCAQSGVVTFDQCTAGSDTVTHYAVTDSITTGAGNVLIWGTLGSAQNIVAGNTPSIADGEASLTISAGGVGTVLAHKIMDHLLRNITYTPETLSVGLGTQVIVDADTGATVGEVAALYGYGRVLVPSWDIAAAGASQNTNVFTFGPPSGGSWGTVVSMFVSNSNVQGAGDILFYGNDTVDQLIADGDTVSVAAGACSVTID